MKLLARLLFALVLGLNLLAMDVSWLSAKDFRVETQTVLDQQKHPTSHTVTLFVGTQVYDIPILASVGKTAHEVVVVLDLKQLVFTLVNRSLRVTTSVSIEVLKQHEEQMAVRVRSGRFPAWFHELAQPGFQVDVERSGTRLRLRGDKIRYDVSGHADVEVATINRYLQFADATARLNFCLMDWPPQARLHLNETLQQHGLMPEEVSVAIFFDDRTYRQKAIHTFAEGISPTDSKLQAQVDHELRNWTSLEWKEYLAKVRNRP
ncbi:MAG: hypothetical protein MK179_16580 [Pirellulaceae bacterium]|nr:hypothetical protein [Pirellulaceae bacterium]